MLFYYTLTEVGGLVLGLAARDVVALPPNYLLFDRYPRLEAVGYCVVDPSTATFIDLGHIHDS